MDCAPSPIKGSLESDKIAKPQSDDELYIFDCHFSASD